MNGIIGTRKKSSFITTIYITIVIKHAFNGLFDRASQLSEGKATKLQQFNYFAS